MKHIASGMMLTLLLVSISTLASNTQPVGASGTIYIRADGSIDPPTTPISSVDNVTYTFTADTNRSIKVERNHIVVDGAGHTILGDGTGNGIDLTGRNNVTIKNARIRGFDYGIWLSYSVNNTLSGNVVSDDGIYLRYSTNNMIVGNAMPSCFRGIWLDGFSSNNTLIGNTVENAVFEGIYLEYSADNILSGNTVSGSEQYGIDLYRSNNNVLSGNVATGSSLYGVELYCSSNNTLSNNTASNNRYNFHVYGESFSDFNNRVDTSNTVDGKPVYYLIGTLNTIIDAQTEAGIVYLINCRNITVRNLTLARNRYALVLWNTTNSKIENIVAQQNLYGIWGESSDRNTLVGNDASNNDGYGIRLWFSSNNMLVGNIASNNGHERFEYMGHGIELDSSTNNTLVANTVSGNTMSGIDLYNSSKNVISGNTASSNYVPWYDSAGISLWGSSNNTVSGNTLSNNQCGITLTKNSSSNNIFHNNFINNTNQTCVQDSFDNSWDNGCEGNYWSGYSGTAFDKYGIGYDPYVISENNTDDCPLMNPYVSGDVNHDAKVNIVDITIIAKAFGSQLGDTKWDPHADMNEDGRVNIVDISKAAKEFGKEWVW